MKHIIKIMLPITFLISFTNTQAQVLNNDLDRMEYLKSFEINKGKYIGKTLSFLLAEIELIQPKTVYSYSAFTNKNERIRTTFYFVDRPFIRSTSPGLIIYWQTPIPSIETINLQKKNNYVFTLDEKTFYGDKIIKDIKVY